MLELPTLEHPSDVPGECLKKAAISGYPYPLSYRITVHHIAPGHSSILRHLSVSSTNLITYSRRVLPSTISITRGRQD